MLQDSKLNPEDLERRLIESQMDGAQEILNDMFATPGVSAKELLEALNRDAWKPLLSRLVINQKAAKAKVEAKVETSEPEAARPYTGKKRGRKPKIQTEEAATDLSSIPEKNRATYGGGDKRKVVMFTTEQKDDQKKLIWKTVNAKQKEITTPQIIKTIKGSYPEINDSVVREMIKEMAKEKVLAALKRKGGKTKAIKYTVGSVAL